MFFAVSDLDRRLIEDGISNTILTLPLAMQQDSSMYVNRARWSDDGKYCGAAYSKHLMHLYLFNEPNELLLHLEIDSHIGGVNAIGFWKPNNEFFIVTCGDDKTIKAIQSGKRTVGRLVVQSRSRCVVVNKEYIVIIIVSLKHKKYQHSIMFCTLDLSF
ncbi:BTB/POZ domain-containing protein [Platanthera zijinensis]|uniref:BTB/POZ domain-containing protein n=1 Tax=Platanthera zijinensis TaxID=2320716 RepID=A0AAP0FT78_9ASPA